MRIVQVNIGHRRSIESDGDTYDTGIYKQAVPDRTEVGELGLADDVICDARFHGGRDQAVYLYSVEDYAHWQDEYGREFAPGTFGENLTTRDLDLRSLCVGDILRSNTLALQVTAPRVPCNTLEARVGQRGFARAFMKERRSGAYCRVLAAGSVAAGDEFEVEPYDGERLPLTTFLDDLHRKLDAETLQHYLAAPIDERNRADFEKSLAKL